MAISKRPAAAHRPGRATGGKRRRVVGTISDYDTESCLGEGTFGVVVKARHRATGQSVAIKSLCDPADEHGLLREARFLEACGGHPNIVGFRDVVRDYVTGDLCLVMEYVQGQSLDGLLRDRRGGGVSEATARGFMWQLLTAAKRMHGCHVVHRDIKPANIIVVGEGEEVVKICDFGFALSLLDARPYNEGAGTRWYRAPEMLMGSRSYDALVDTWALGCVMAEILTGERLFQENGIISMLRRIFQVVGAPDDTTWPGFTSRQLAAEVRQVLTGQQSTLREMFPEEKPSKEGFDVLSGLLTCNPDKRLTAAAALKLPWFATFAANAQPVPPPATTAISIKEEEVEIAPSPWRRKRVTAKKTLLGKKAQLIAPPAT